MANLRHPSVWFMVWVLVSGLSAATMIGWWSFDAHPSLGPAAFRSHVITLYEPWRAVDWWSTWHTDQAFRATFIRGLSSAGILGLLVAAIGLHLVRSFGPLPHVQAEEQPDRYGSVRELLQSKRISLRKKGVVLGRAGHRIVYHTGDDHVLLVGASRVGEKGVSFVLPTLADCPDSMVVFDPKGELHEATADERAKRGPVYLWDPTRPGTHRFNPLRELRDDERNIGDCRALGMLMTHDMKGRDPFWATKAADLCSGLIRIVCTDGGSRTLERVRAMALEVAAGHPPATSDKYAREMIQAHMGMEARPRSGVDAQVQLALAFAGDPAVTQAVERSEFQVSDLCAGKHPVTVYLTLPASQAESLRNLARIVLQSLLLGMLHDRRVASNGAAKTRRVLWLVDEFPTLGHLPFIEHGLAIAAGHGLKMFLVAQDMNQVEDAYGREQSILANCGTFVWVPSFSRETYEHASAIAGTMIAQMRARHRKVGIVDRPSETASQSRHPVLNPREAQVLSRDHALVMHAGTRPTWLRKARYHELSRYDGRVKDTHVSYGTDV